MSRSLTAQDRSSLIRLASALPAGSPGRKAILSGLSRIARTEEEEDVGYTAFRKWYRKNKSVVDRLEERTIGGGSVLSVVERPDYFEMELFLGWDDYDRENSLKVFAFKNEDASDRHWADSVFSADWDDGWSDKSDRVRDAVEASEEGVLTENLVYAALDQMLSIAKKAVKPILKVKEGPEGEIQYYLGVDFLGEVWEGLDGNWHNSKNKGLVFETEEDAKKDLFSKGPSGRGSAAPIFE